MPALELEDLSKRLADPEWIGRDPFSAAKDVADYCSIRDYDTAAQDLVLRSLENLTAFGPAREIVNALVRECGLFPYLDLNTSDTKDLFAAAMHHYPKLGEKFILHRQQRAILALLLDGKSVVLSAPTSFGKSALIDAFISSGLHSNILILVPTIALMDEMRRRLTRTFSPEWKVITHLEQEKHKKNIYVLTAERTNLSEIGPLDFYVIDEFYKLGNESEKDRHATLNKVCYRLLQRKIQFFMLGPNIEDIPDQLKSQCEFRKTEYKTVAVNVMLLDADPIDETVRLCMSLQDSTIVFCRSPERIMEISRRLIEAGMATDNPQALLASDWAGRNYNPEWHYARAMRHGIGVHHGSIPRSLAYWAVRAFNNRWLKLLLCTTTLIEGVNTRAKTLIIVDSKVNNKDISFFTFNNIKGRAGRMMQHFVGDVYTFTSAPQAELPFVDLPIFTQPESTSSSILLGMDTPDLTPSSKQRVDQIAGNGVLSLEFLKRTGLDPEQQIGAAQEILKSPELWGQTFSWKAYPKWAQLKAVNALVWEHLGGKTATRGSVYSSDQLTKFIFDLARKDFPKMIQDFAGQEGMDSGVQRANAFIRNWATFHFPRLFLAVGAIATEVLTPLGYEVADCATYALSVERLFYDSAIVALDEYGVPLPLAAKLEGYLAAGNNLDATLQRLRTLDIDRLELHRFERGLLRAARESLR